MVDPQSLTHRHKQSPSKSRRDGEAIDGGGRVVQTGNNGSNSNNSPGGHKGKTRPRRNWMCLLAAGTIRSERRRTNLLTFLGICAVTVAVSSFAALPAMGAMRIAGRQRPPSTVAVARPRLLVASDPWHVREVKRKPKLKLGRRVYFRSRADSQKLGGNRHHFEKDNCVAIRPWQLEHHPTCNSMHEVTISEMDGDAELVNGGDYRDVWRVLDYDMETPRAFKSMQIDRHEEGHRVYEMMRNEAVAMDHLTKSKYVGSVHGFCALSAIYEFSTGGTFKKAAKKGLLSSKEKLELSLQVAKATRDVHDLYDEGVVTITVADISSGQFVKNDDTGIYQLMDLNVLHFMTWDKDTHELCMFQGAPSAGYVRSPEEYSRASGFDEKIDVWAMGNVLHFLITGEYGFCVEDYSRNTVVRKVKDGVLPPSYDDIEKGGDPIEIEILHVVKNTRATKKEDRWPAKKAVEYLEEVWRKVESGEIKPKEGGGYRRAAESES